MLELMPTLQQELHCHEGPLVAVAIWSLALKRDQHSHLRRSPPRVALTRRIDHNDVLVLLQALKLLLIRALQLQDWVAGHE